MTEHTGIVRLQLEIWHPDCWTLEVTEKVSAGLLSGVHLNTSGRPVYHMTAYADTTTDVEELVNEARMSPHLTSISEMKQSYYRSEPFVSIPGNATRELLIEKRHSVNQISEALVSRGFVCAEPIRMYNGTEYWTVLTTLDRKRIRSALDAIREQEGAEIRVRQLMRATDVVGHGALPLDRLSVRQREVFELARERGYYAWPKKITPKELADELGITASTLHEHLYKAEAKLLDTSRKI